MRPRMYRPRRAKRKRDVQIDDAVPVSKLHLDPLSDDALQHVVQNMSAKPRVANWRGFCAAEDVLGLLRMGGRFADAA